LAWLRTKVVYPFKDGIADVEQYGVDAVVMGCYAFAAFAVTHGAP